MPARATALIWSSASLTDQGRVRKLNEDSLLDDPGRQLWAVADGMGGHDSGEVASQLIAVTLQKTRCSAQVADTADEIDRALQAVNSALFKRGAAAHKTMGSTVVVAFAAEHLLSVLWAGDSRAYLFRRGVGHLLTRDHTQFEALVELGEARPEEVNSHQGAGVVTRAVGAQDTLVLDVEVVAAEPGDWVLLCSDGVGKHVADHELPAYFEGNNPHSVVERLIGDVLTRGAKDNVTVIVMRAEEASDRTITRTPAPMAQADQRSD